MPPEKGICQPCGVLLLDLKLSPEMKRTSIKEAEKQWNICRQKCLRRNRSNAVKTEPTDDYFISTTDHQEENLTENQKFPLRIKEEPPSPESDPRTEEPEQKQSGEPRPPLPETTEKSLRAENSHSQSPSEKDANEKVVDKKLLSKLLRITRQMKSRDTVAKGGSYKPPTVEVKVEMLEPCEAEKDLNKPKVKKERGVNKDFLIKDEPLRFTTIHSKNTSKQNTSKTAVVQPRILSKPNTHAIPKQGKSETSTSSSLSVPSTTTTISEGNHRVPEKTTSISSSSPSTSVHVIGAARVVEKISESMKPSVVPSGDMSILQLMDGQLVLGPTETFKKISANTSLVPPTGMSNNVLNVPIVPPVNLGTTLPTVFSPMTSPAINFLSPIGPNLVTPTITPQLWNVTPGLLGQPGGLPSPIFLVPQTGSPNTTLLFQPSEGQVNVTSYQPPQMQLLNTSMPVIQYSNETVVPAKPSEAITSTKVMNARSYLQLPDGHFVPIVSNPTSFAPTVKQDNYMGTVSSSVNSRVRLTNTVSSNPITSVSQNSSTGQSPGNVASYLASVPSLPNGPVNQNFTQFLQLQDGSLIPIIGQNQAVPIQNGTPLSSSTQVRKPPNQNLPTRSDLTPSYKNTNSNPPTRSDLTPSYKNTNSNPPTRSDLTPSYKNTNSASELLKKLVKERTILKLQEKKHEQLQILAKTVPWPSAPSSKQSDRSFLTSPTSSGSMPTTATSSTSPFPTTDPTNKRKEAPFILQASKTKQNELDFKEIGNPSTVASGFVNVSEASHVVEPSSKGTPRLVFPNKFISAGKADTGELNQTKIISKRKSPNVVKEDYGVKKRKTMYYSTQAVIDVDAEDEIKKNKDKNTEPRFVFIRDVLQPNCRPVLLDSTIEEKGIRLPDNMTM